MRNKPMTEERKKQESCKRTDDEIFSLIVFFNLSSDMVDNSMISSATSTVRGSCTEGRRSHTRRLSSLFFFLSFLSFLRIWLEDAGERLWYKICYSMYVCPCVASDWWRKRSNTRSWSHLTPMACTLFGWWLPRTHLHTRLRPHYADSWSLVLFLCFLLVPHISTISLSANLNKHPEFVQ